VLDFESPQDVTRAGTLGTSTWSEGHLEINLILKNACQYAELILGSAVLQPFQGDGWTRMHHGIKLTARMQITRSYCILVNHWLVASLPDNSIAGSRIMPSVAPRSTLRDSVAEAGVVRYQRSPARFKGQFEPVKPSASPNHTFIHVLRFPKLWGLLWRYFAT